MSDKTVMDHIIAALRGRGNPDNSDLLPANMSLRGYQLYVKEAQQMGEQVVPYQMWIKQQQAPPTSQNMPAPQPQQQMPPQQGAPNVS